MCRVRPNVIVFLQCLFCLWAQYFFQVLCISDVRSPDQQYNNNNTIAKETSPRYSASISTNRAHRFNDDSEARLLRDGANGNRKKRSSNNQNRQPSYHEFEQPRFGSGYRPQRNSNSQNRQQSNNDFEQQRFDIGYTPRRISNIQTRQQSHNGFGQQQFGNNGNRQNIGKGLDRQQRYNDFGEQERGNSPNRQQGYINSGNRQQKHSDFGNQGFGNNQYTPQQLYSNDGNTSPSGYRNTEDRPQRYFRSDSSSSGQSSQSSSGQRTYPTSNGQRTQSSSGQRSQSSSGQRTYPTSNGQITQSSNGQRTSSSNGQRTQSSRGQRTYPTSNGQRTQSSNSQRTQSSNSQRTPSSNGQRTYPEANGQRTQSSNGQRTPSSSGQRTPSSNSQRTYSASSDQSLQGRDSFSSAVDTDNNVRNGAAAAAAALTPPMRRYNPVPKRDYTNAYLPNDAIDWESLYSDPVFNLTRLHEMFGMIGYTRVYPEQAISLYQQWFPGEATFFGLSGEGTCDIALETAPPAAQNSRYLAALNVDQFMGSAACGMCFRVQASGRGAGMDQIMGDFIIYIRDLCLGCNTGDMDLAIDGDGRWEIQIRAVQCPVGNTPIEYLLKGSNSWFLRMQVRNTRVPVSTVSVRQDEGGEWRELRLTHDGHWSASAGRFDQSRDMQVRLTSVTGVTLEDAIPPSRENGAHVVVAGRNQIQFPEDSSLPSASP